MPFDATTTRGAAATGARARRTTARYTSAASAGPALIGALDAAVAAAAAGLAAAPGLTAIKAPAGLGKTQAMLAALARHGDALLALGHVVVYAPTLLLADEMAERFAALHTGLPHLVLRGRGASVDGAPLCERADIAARLGGVAPSVARALCEDPQRSGASAVASCRQGCRWWRHIEGDGSRIVFASHAYLTLPLPSPLAGAVALRLIDESFWQGLSRIGAMPLETFLIGGPTPEPSLSARLFRARAAIYEALAGGAGVCGTLRRRGVTRRDLMAFAAHEARAAVPPIVSPGMTPAQQRKVLATFDRAAFGAAQRRAAIWRLLADTPARRETERLTLGVEVSDAATGARRAILTSHSLAALPDDAPVIAIDADADPEILACFAPVVRFHAIAAPAQAEVVQVIDRTLSKQYLLDPEMGRARRDVVLAVIAREKAAAPNGRVLAVANKSVVAALHDDAGSPGEGLERLRAPLGGVDFRWFGPSIRGVDSFVGHDTVVIVGRHELRPQTIDALMRCLWGERAGARMTFADGMFSSVDVLVAPRGGAARTQRVAMHPDPRGRRVHAALREANTAQAVARIRPMHPSGPKRVVLLCSLPIPGLVVDRLTTLGRLRHTRLHDALAASGWSPLTLTPEGLTAAAPGVFVSANAAQKWIGRIGGRDGLARAVRDAAAAEGRSVAIAARAATGRRGAAPLVATFGPAGGGG